MNRGTFWRGRVHTDRTQFDSAEIALRGGLSLRLGIVSVGEIAGFQDIFIDLLDIRH